MHHYTMGNLLMHGATGTESAMVVAAADLQLLKFYSMSCIQGWQCHRVAGRQNVATQAGSLGGVKWSGLLIQKSTTYSS